MIDPRRFLETFLEEAGEHLDVMEQALLRLETDPSGPHVDEIFRAAHSIKGGASTFGLPEIARFTHSLEGLLDRIRKGELKPTPSRVELLLRAADVTRNLLASARDNAAPPPIAAVLEELDRERTDQPTPTPTIHAHAHVNVNVNVNVNANANAHDPAAATDWQISFRPDSETFRRGLDPLLFLRDLADLGEILETHADTADLPDLADLDPGASYLGWTVQLRTTADEAAIREVFAFLDGGYLSIAPAKEPSPNPIPIPTSEPAAPAPAHTPETATVRVPIEKVDRLMNLLGEIVIAQSMVSQIAMHGELREAMDSLERRTRELQERVMAIRMAPVVSLFNRFPRLVRDVAGALGKQAALQLVGAETELDRGVLERITDPLTHLIRNAVDHGIEAPAERRAAGKPERGTITLSAAHQAGGIVIEVADDGRGLDRDRLRARARDLGLIAEGEALSDEETLELVCRPGFSTARAVSDISGRGVGMDVVKRNIQALNGTMRIRSEAGRGTCFRLSLPLTLAIIDGLCLSVGSERYVVPLVAIVETLRLPPGSVRQVAGRGETVVVRGAALPLLRLHRLFGLQARAADLGGTLVVIVESEGRRVALAIDDIQGQVQAVIKSLEANYRPVDGVMGATILGDGRIALILDVVGLMRMGHGARRAA